jgi:hypothetical protein
MDYEQNRRDRISNDPEYAEKRRLQKRAAAKADRERNKWARTLARRSEPGATYDTGKPCSRGHLSPRYAGNQTCVMCSQEDRKIADQKRAERLQTDPTFAVRRRAQKATSNRGYCKRNRDLKNAAWAKWRADRIQRTPKWADLKKIRAVYNASTRVSRVTGIQHHVDHVIPLKGKLVSGLHIAENLRVLPGPENLAKGSKFMP